jgi:hypothetical protein
VKPLNGLGELKNVRKQIQDRALQRRLEQTKQAAQRLDLSRQQAPQRLFLAAIGKVQPLIDPGRTTHPPKRPAPLPLQLMRDEKEVLRSSLSDDFDVSSLLDTDDSLSYARPGVGPRRMGGAARTRPARPASRRCA